MMVFSLSFTQKFRKQYKYIYLFLLVIVLVSMVIFLGSSFFEDAALSPTLVKVTSGLIIVSVVLGEFADDIFENKLLIFVLEILSEAILFGMLWGIFYVYVRKGLSLIGSDPALMLDGLYGGFALTNMIFWGKLTLFAFEDFTLTAQQEETIEKKQREKAFQK